MVLSLRATLKTEAPTKAPKMAEIPNCIRMDFSANRPRRASFNTLFKKWTMAVRATANSTGKNMANTGINSVPNPKPENSVNAAAAARSYTNNEVIHLEPRTKKRSRTNGKSHEQSLLNHWDMSKDSPDKIKRTKTLKAGCSFSSCRAELSSPDYPLLDFNGRKDNSGQNKTEH